MERRHVHNGAMVPGIVLGAPEVLLPSTTGICCNGTDTWTDLGLRVLLWPITPSCSVRQCPPPLPDHFLPWLVHLH